MAKTYWFIDPTGQKEVNEALSRELPEEDSCTDVICADNVRRDLWLCPNHEFVAKVLRRFNRRQYHYMVYIRNGRSGKIRRWRFDDKSGLTRLSKQIERSKVTIRLLIREATELQS